MEKEEALNELQKEREGKRLMQIENATIRQRYESLENEMKKMQEEKYIFKFFETIKLL